MYNLPTTDNQKFTKSPRISRVNVSIVYQKPPVYLVFVSSACRALIKHRTSTETRIQRSKSESSKSILLRDGFVAWFREEETLSFHSPAGWLNRLKRSVTGGEWNETGTRIAFVDFLNSARYVHQFIYSSRLPSRISPSVSIFLSVLGLIGEIDPFRESEYRFVAYFWLGPSELIEIVVSFEIVDEDAHTERRFRAPCTGEGR